MKYKAVILDLEGTLEVPGTMVYNPKPEGVVLQPGVKDGLAVLQKHFQLFIVSNCGTRMLERFLNFDKMRAHFQDWECLGTSGKGKADNISDIVSRNHLSQVVYVGDSFPDARAAGDAKVDYLHAAYGNDGFLTGAQNFDTFKAIVEYLIQ